MSNRYPALVLFALLIAAPAWSQDWRWAQRAGASERDVAFGVVVDPEGNTYVTGHFSGTVEFGTVALTSAGSSDVFLTKYAPDGTVLWAQRAGGLDSDVGATVALDGEGMVYVGGNFQGTAAFEAVTLVSAGSSDVFVAKYTPDGTVLWAQRGGGTQFEHAADLAVDTAGNAFLTGLFEGTISFGPFPLTSAGGGDVYVVKFDAGGSVQWARRAGGARHEWARGIAVDAAGNTFVTGDFYGTATFGVHSVTSVHLLREDMFLAKYDPAGTALWARRGGGEACCDTGHDVAVDGAGNAYVAGQFLDAATFGDHTVTAAFGIDAFVAKYDPSGTVEWARSGGGSSGDIAYGIAADAAGRTVVTGGFLETAAFGPFTLTSAGWHDIFVVEYDPNGIPLSAHRAGGPVGDEAESGFAVGLRADGDAYVVGAFQGTAAFGATSLTSAGDYDLFVARLGTGAIAAEPGPAAGALALSARPNPVRARADVTFRLERPGPVRLALYDVLGREALVVFDAALPAGPHGVPLVVSSLPPGHYLLRLQTPDGAASRPLTVAP